MSLFEDLIANETLVSVRARIVEQAKAADLKITNWLVGAVGQQTLEAFTQVTHQTSLNISAAIRGYGSLDTSTDPGDEDPYDSTNADLEPEAGFLSDHGASNYGTPRGEATFASGFVTFVNGGTIARTFAPESLTFTWTDESPPSPPPTYRNAPDPAIYTNPDGTVTVAALATLVIPISAEEIGTRSNAPSSALSLTTTLSGCTATNAAPIAGTDRESAADYRARCRQAAARLSLGGPSAAYEYLAKTNLDGTVLLNASGNPVNISRVQVSQESDTGIVDVFYASPAGAATSEDVTAANTNIELEAFATPDTITFTGAAAVEVPIAVAGTAKVKAAAGVADPEAAAKAAIVAELVEAFAAYPVGGEDQVDGAGVIYTRDIQADAAQAYPGLYALLVTTPAGASTALAKGEVATLNTTVGDWTVTVVT